MRAARTLALSILTLWAAPACRAEQPRLATPVSVVAPETPAQPDVTLPNDKDSLHFAVIGDFGTGETPSFELAERVLHVHRAFKLDFILTVGDNLYGMERPQDFRRKFEQPYKPLLDDGVKVYASLGNHDSREQRYYELFNMDGKLYYSLKAPKQDVRFFALDSTYPVPEQIAWLEQELADSKEAWKIVYLHHPLYSSGERHGSHVKLRQRLEPLLVEHGVSVVFAGHDHFYERIKPQRGIVHFVAGSGGALRIGNIDRDTGLTAKGFDDDRAFMVVEILGDRMYFQAISRTGEIVDSGIVERRGAAPQ